MNYIIAVFYSRASTLRFSNLLKQNNIPCAIINTPQEIHRACGISVKLLADFFPKVKSLFAGKGFDRNFDGFFAIVQSGGRDVYQKLKI